MTHPDTKPEALHIADACEDSATVWAHEIDTRRDAARELRRLHAECESLRTQLAEAQRLASGRLEQMTADLAQALRWRADARRLDWFADHIITIEDDCRMSSTWRIHADTGGHHCGDTIRAAIDAAMGAMREQP